MSRPVDIIVTKFRSMSADKYSSTFRVKWRLLFIYFPIFKTVCLAKKISTGNKDNSFYLGRKYARVFVLGHFPFHAADSFPGATLSESCSLLLTDNVRRQKLELIIHQRGSLARDWSKHFTLDQWISLKASQTPYILCY